MLAVLMTVAYVRHCSDGRMCAEYIRNLLEGLRCVVQRLDNSKQNLGGWVSKTGVLMTTDPHKYLGLVIQISASMELELANSSILSLILSLFICQLYIDLTFHKASIMWT